MRKCMFTVRASANVGFQEDKRVCMDWDYRRIIQLKSYERNYSWRWKVFLLPVVTHFI